MKTQENQFNKKNITILTGVISQCGQKYGNYYPIMIAGFALILPVKPLPIEFL